MTKELQEMGRWKVGMLVIEHGTSIRPEKIMKITRITDGRKGTIYVDDIAFDIGGSMRGGDGWDRLYISPATQEDLERVAGKIAINRLQKIQWQKLTPAKALEIEKILNDNGIVTKPSTPS